MEKGISKEVYMPIMSRDCYYISTDKPMLEIRKFSLDKINKYCIF